MLHRNQVAWIAIGLTLFLSACSTPNFVMTATAVPAPVATTTPTGTPTPPNEVFLSEIVRTPQPSPWATSLPNDLGITPGITTEAEVRSRFGDPKSPFCLIDDKWVWIPPCKAPDDFRKVFGFVEQNLYLQIAGGRVVSVIFGIALLNMPRTTVQTIIDKYGRPDLVQFIIPEHQNPQPSPYGQLVYASKGVEFVFDCHAAPGELCKGAPRDGLVVWETHFAPLSVTEWFEQEKTNPPHYSERGLEFYIRPWTGFHN